MTLLEKTVLKESATELRRLANKMTEMSKLEISTQELRHKAAKRVESYGEDAYVIYKKMNSLHDVFQTPVKK